MTTSADLGEPCEHGKVRISKEIYKSLGKRIFCVTCCCACRYSEEGLVSTTVDGYRKPQLVRGWERGLLRFVAARISSASILAFRI